MTREATVKCEEPPWFSLPRSLSSLCPAKLILLGYRRRMSSYLYANFCLMWRNLEGTFWNLNSDINSCIHIATGDRRVKNQTDSGSSAEISGREEKKKMYSTAWRVSFTLPCKKAVKTSIWLLNHIEMKWSSSQVWRTCHSNFVQNKWNRACP